MSAPDFIEIAKNILEKATKFENESNYSESLLWYEEGLAILITSMKMEDCNKSEIKSLTLSYMNKAESIKGILDQENGLDSLRLNPGRHQQIKIEANSTGHSYKSIFHKFLIKGDVDQVCVEDPYVRDAHQIGNFVSFCEMLVKSPSKIRLIKLTTGTDKPRSPEQLDSLSVLSRNMRTRGVELSVTYSDKLHDREIRFSNGWIVKIGRGLDYFRRLPNSAILGVHDFDFRPCLETTVDIFHQKVVCQDNN